MLLIRLRIDVILWLFSDSATYNISCVLRAMLGCGCCNAPATCHQKDCVIINYQLEPGSSFARVVDLRDYDTLLSIMPSY